MDVKELAKSLHPLERKVLPHLDKYSTISELMIHSNLQEVEVMRAVQWLQNKKAVDITESTIEIVKLDKNGESYKEHGLPERNFLKQIKKEFQPVEKVAKDAKVLPDELNICIGALRKKAAVELEKTDCLRIKLTPAGETLISKPSLEEHFLKTLDSPRDTK